MDLTKDDQFYDEGKPFDDEKFDTLEDQHLEEASKQEPFSMPDLVNELMAGFARL